MTLSNKIKSNRIKSNQIKSNQIKSNQIKSNQIKSNQIKSNQIKSNQICFSLLQGQTSTCKVQLTCMPLKRVKYIKRLSLLTKLLILVQQTMSFGNEFHTLTILIEKKISSCLILNNIYIV